MPTYRFYQIDVFTRRPLAGNALAVFPDADGLTAPQMQALAREMNLSETTFVLPSGTATRRVRFFTPTAEIPLAGHPTVGTWWTLAELDRLDLPADGNGTVTQETGAGVLPVHIRMAGGQPAEVTMVQAHPQFGPTVDDVGALAEALGGRPDLIASQPRSQVVSTALPQLMVPVASLEALSALPVGGTGGRLADLLRRYGTDCVMLYTSETTSPDATVHCRMFAPGLGVAEDPATGSAAGALGAYLVHHRAVDTAGGSARVIVEQGIEIGRPSRILVTVAVRRDGAIEEVRVGGEAVTVIEGEVRL
ncbi:MAG: PhzF family phenazine biosynthesis protein [Gemmatimonadales bacterium]|nr:PhzF family phenazine biosynthesis protein [Gemmatimonadales bacterium]